MCLREVVKFVSGPGEETDRQANSVDLQVNIVGRQGLRVDFQSNSVGTVSSRPELSSGIPRRDEISQTVPS